MTRYPAILAAVQARRWAIHEPKMTEIMAVLSARMSGLAADAASLQAMAADNRTANTGQTVRSVGVINVFGTICQRISLMDESSGGRSTESIGREFREAMADDSIGSVLLNIDSPGGTICGVPELASMILSHRGQKPTCAVCNSLMASAAYWIGSACDSVSVTPSGEAGSIGVLAVHCDASGFNEEAGLKYTYVTYGKHKAEYTQDFPLSEEALAELQRRVDEDGELFARAVAKARGVTPGVVRDRFGQGRVYGAGEAVDRGMADRVETLEEAIARMSGAKSARGRRAEIERQRLGLM